VLTIYFFIRFLKFLNFIFRKADKPYEKNIFSTVIDDFKKNKK